MCSRPTVVERSKSSCIIQIVDEEGRGFEPRRGLIQDFVFLLWCRRIEWKDRMEGSNDLRSAVLRGTKESFESTFFEWRHLQILQYIKNVMIKDEIQALDGQKRGFPLWGSHIKKKLCVSPHSNFCKSKISQCRKSFHDNIAYDLTYFQ